MKYSLSRLSVLMFLAACLAVQTTPGLAELITTDQAAQAEPQRDREKVKDFIERASVQERLVALGVDAVMVKDRVDALTDQEVSQLAQRIDSLPAGGTLSQMDWIIILLIAILVAIVV